MRILPIFSFYDIQTVEKHILTFVQYVQEQGSNIRLSIRTPVNVLTALDKELQLQLSPFISSGRINIFPDSADAAFQGLMNITDLRSYLKKSVRAFSKLYPELSPIFVPRWHDYQREKVQTLYRDILKKVFLPLHGTGRGSYYRVLNNIDGDVTADVDADGNEWLIPVVFPNNLNSKQFSPGLRGKIIECRQEVRRLMARGVFQQCEDWDSALMIDGDRYCEKALNALLTLSKKGYEFTCGRPNLQLLQINTEKSKEFTVDWPDFNPLSFGPEFMAQFFPISRGEERSPPVFSTFHPLPAPVQHRSDPSPERAITTSLTSRAEMVEENFRVTFERGNISSIANSESSFDFAGGVGSLIKIQRGRSEKSHVSEMENAVAVENEKTRGLRQILGLSATEMKISGRITNDFLLVGDEKALYIDSYIQHPWIQKLYRVNRYIPQMIMLWNEVPAGTVLTLSSKNHDGTGRAVSINLSQIASRSSLFLPGYAWLLSCGDSRIGIDLICDRKLKIHFPAVVLVEAVNRKAKVVNRKNYRISFLPTAEYINPDTSIMNGLLEHYTLRLMPDIENFKAFGKVGQDILDHVADPFIVYF